MDINTFITKLEEELGCEGMGYEKCLESIIHTQEQLKMEEEKVEELENEIEEIKDKHKEEINVEKKVIVDMIDMIKKLTIGIVLTNNNNEFQDEIELTNPKSKKWKKGFTKQQEKVYHTILDEMNDTDWNEDKGSCKLFYEEKSKTLGFEIIDSDEE